MGILVVGVGNPGREYARTRHNAGFWFLDALAERLEVAFAEKKNFFGCIASLSSFASALPSSCDDESPVSGTECRLLRPATFMNESGRAVAAVKQYFRIPVENILVAHDEADLPPGEVKLKFGGGHAGHNGLADIIRALGGRDFWRLRLGVGKLAGGDIADYLLSAPAKAEREKIDAAITRALNITPRIIAGQWQDAMLHLHTVAKAGSATDKKSEPDPAKTSKHPGGIKSAIDNGN